MGHAEHGGERRESRTAAGREVWAQPAFLGSPQAAPHSNFGPRCRTADGPRAASSARSDQSLRLCGSGDFAEGPFQFDLVVAPGKWRLERKMGNQESN